jgi:antitoxin component YwqK of YwqJK toxin-antitoxin module
MRPLRPLLFLLTVLLLAAGACSKKTVSFNSKPDQALAGAVVRDSLTTARDTVNAPSLETKKVVLTKEQEKAAKDKEKLAQRSKKPKKNVFLGERIKKGFTKSGPKGRNQYVEIFYYLKTFQQPNDFAPARYYFDPRKRKIFKTTDELDPATAKVLHGPYKKLQGGKVIETGFFALGTRHLRWEKYDKNNVLLSKLHYEMGFPRDAQVNYYANDKKRLKEVIPYADGKLEGDYVSFTEHGKREWEGQFENGKKVGEWTKFWGFRNTKDRRHYVYQYGESGYDPEVTEPVLLKEYNRNGVMVFEKDKYDKRDAVTDRPGSKK